MLIVDQNIEFEIDGHQISKKDCSKHRLVQNDLELIDSWAIFHHSRVMIMFEEVQCWLMKLATKLE